MAEDMNKSAAETEEEYQPDLMTLEDEDGNEVTFEVIDALDHKGVHYLAVVEYAENEEDLDEDAQLVILSVGGTTRASISMWSRTMRPCWKSASCSRSV